MGTKEEKFRLVSVKSKKKAGTRSIYKMDNTNSYSGMRVKLTFTFSAIGACAPIFVSVCGLSERELPNDKCLILEIEGMCIGGGGVSVGKKDVGYLILMRTSSDKDEVPDKQRFKYYRDKILLPFVKQSRQEYDGYNEEECGTIPKELSAVSWCDGDLSQIASVIEDLPLFQENKITANKQNNARSGVEQPADLTKTFKILKRIQQEYTVSNIPIKSHPLKRIIHKQFDKLSSEGRLRLPSNKRRALTDFLSNIPAISTRAVTTEYIQHGFITAGMIDLVHR